MAVTVISTNGAEIKLSDLLEYAAETGCLTWLPRAVGLFPNDAAHRSWNTRYAGVAALTTLCDGYRRGAIFGKSYLAHRVAWALVHGEWPEDQIDHINGCRTDNRIANLRCVTNQENLRNTARYSHNTSGHIGVHWEQRRRKWRASIKVDGKKRHIGYYPSLDEANQARLEANRLHGFHANHGRAASTV